MCWGQVGQRHRTTQAIRRGGERGRRATGGRLRGAHHLITGLLLLLYWLPPKLPHASSWLGRGSRLGGQGRSRCGSWGRATHGRFHFQGRRPLGAWCGPTKAYMDGKTCRRVLCSSPITRGGLAPASHRHDGGRRYPLTSLLLPGAKERCSVDSRMQVALPPPSPAQYL
jgi:hypothetical protein